jgi:ADP-ribosylglycohydrolase
MNLCFRRSAVVFLFVALFSLAYSRGQQQTQQEDTRLPSGKSQRDEILKAEHEQNIKDAAQLVDLAQQLQQDLEKNERFVLSISTLKKTDDIEKLVKKIRSRLRHN